MNLWARLLLRLGGLKVLTLSPGAVVVFELHQRLPLEHVARMREVALAMVQKAEPTADVLFLDPDVRLAGLVERGDG